MPQPFKFSEVLPPKKPGANGTAYEEGDYLMTFVGFGKPFAAVNNLQQHKPCNGKGCDECGGTGHPSVVNLKLFYRFDDDGSDYEETATASVFAGGTKKDGSPMSKSKLYLRACVLAQTSDVDAINAFDWAALGEVPIIGKFGRYNEDPTNAVKLRSIRLREAPVRTPAAPPQVAIESPSLASIKQAYIDTGRSEEEFKGWFVVQTGNARSVSPDVRIRLMRAIGQLPTVEPKTIAKAAAQAGFEEEELVDF